MRPGNTWLEKLAYSNVWLALTASGFAIATLFVAGARDITRVHLVAVLLPALSMYVVYTFDKVVKADPVADAQNDPERSAFVEKYKPLLLALAGVALLVGSGLATVSPGGVRALALFGVPFPIAYAYGTNVLPPGFRYRRLKDVTGGKSLTVAATWAVVGVTLPLVAAGRAAPPALHGFLFAWLLARFFVNTVFFDIGDIEGDLEAGTRTIPVVLGEARTYALLEVSVVASVIIGLNAAALSPAMLPAVALVLAAAGYDMWFLREGQRAESLAYVCDVVADGMGVFTGLAALCAASFSS